MKQQSEYAPHIPVIVTERVPGTPMNTLENTKRYVAEARYFSIDPDKPNEWHKVHSTAYSVDSSYGLQSWVDDDGNSYGQITLNCIGVEVRNVEEISEEEASDWEEEHT